MYVGDLVTGGAAVQETGEKKAVATEIFEDAASKIHKWHSNESELEGAEESPLDVNGEETYAKQQLGETENHEGKLLGIPLEQRKGHTQC